MRKKNIRKSIQIKIGIGYDIENKEMIIEKDKNYQ